MATSRETPRLRRYRLMSPKELIHLFFYRSFQFLFHRPKSWWRTFVAQLVFVTRRTRVPVLPTQLDAEPTNLCNQRCPGCATGDGTISRPRGMMEPEVFGKIMDAVGRAINFSVLYCMGESFLNKNIYKIISMARKNKILSVIDSNGTVSDAEKLVNSGLDYLNIHISGTTQEIHDTYRKRGKLSDILANVRTLVAERKKNPDCRTAIRLGLLVFQQNEHQVDDFFALAKELEVDEAYLIKGTAGPSQANNFDKMENMLTQVEEMNVYDEDAFAKGQLVRKKSAKCSWPWHGTSISWNGDVHPCCHDYFDENKVGNILEEDFDEIWNGEKLRAFRQRLLDGDDIKMCRDCPGYGVGKAVTTLVRKHPEKGLGKRVKDK